MFTNELVVEVDAIWELVGFWVLAELVRVSGGAWSVVVPCELEAITEAALCVEAALTSVVEPAAAASADGHSDSKYVSQPYFAK